MSIAVKGNYTTVRRPASAVRVSATTVRAVRRYIALGATIVGLLCAYGYVYSTTLFLERQVEINRTAIQAQLQQQESLLVRDTKLISLGRVRAAASVMGLVANNTAVIGTLDGLH